MSTLTPVTCELTEGAPQILVRPRHSHNREIAQYALTRYEKLVEVGMARRVIDPIYGSPLFVVHKKGPDKYRTVVDMKLLNKWTKRSALLMPNLEAQIGYTKGANWFGGFDVLIGFAHLPVHEDFLKYFTVVTDFGAFVLLGAPQEWVKHPKSSRTVWS